MIPRIHSVLLSLTIVASAFLLASCSSGPRTIVPGRLSDGTVLLPNGWRLSPAGTHLDIGELPLNADLSPDGRFAIITNDGTRTHSISIIDLDKWIVAQTMIIPKAWLGLKFYDKGRKFVASGGNDNCLRVYSFIDGRAAAQDSVSVGQPWPVDKIWLAGLDVDQATSIAYTVGKENHRMYAIDLDRRSVLRSVELPATPYGVVFDPHARCVWVSLWGGRTVVRVDPVTLALLDSIKVGDHPSAMELAPDGSRLWVTNTNLNTVSVIDVASRKVTETLNTAMSPHAPPGSTPNALAMDTERERLYVANADNNCVTVFDITEPGHSRSIGFIPVGWYPTAIRIQPGTGDIYVANAKGFTSLPNPKGPDPTHRTKEEQYIGALFRGTLSRIAAPDPATLATYSSQVFRNNRYTDQKNTQPGNDAKNPIPAITGGASSIKHVFYVIKENRTYDQVFGDLPEGNGDPNLCLFPDTITPNLHALVREFVLLDNFYADAEVSADGHNWSMGAYATDYVEKTWPTNYGGRGGEYVYEGGDSVVYPSSGYIWDNCRRNGRTYRTYGEYTFNPEFPGDTAKPVMESLAGHVAPFYRGWDLNYSDVDRVKTWMKEFDEYERNGNLPQFQIIKLPNDHTEGTHAGSLTPRAFVAQNDLAVGMLIERISHSRYWKESAIFIIEDDAQNGPDHVDAHRTEALVISPYVRRGTVDREMYSTSSMLRTMELILGLPPLTQFDAAATPMYSSFSPTPDVTPFTCRPAQHNIAERNPDNAVGQLRSNEMDFSREDAIPDIELNEIVWKAIRGQHSEMPAPVRSAFVQVLPDDEEDDD
jgi:YVTN family beta-propeller protein